MKKWKVSLIGAAALVLLAACAPAGSQGGGSLTGNVWVLDSLNGQPTMSGTMITAEFTEDGKVSGTSGCNRYSGSYTASGSTIQIQGPLASTMMACDQPIMDQESAYFTALGAAQKYSIEGEILTLKDSGGAAVAVYKAQSQSLAGTSWQVTGYNNGKQAVTSVMIGTELTAVFGSDGNLAGFAGCNNYNGPYKVDGNKITIGPLASTMMACDQPIMDQESQFLAALQSAATYKIEGARMELRTADGALAADFMLK